MYYNDFQVFYVAYPAEQQLATFARHVLKCFEARRFLRTLELNLFVGVFKTVKC
jgi:hypothetical protein